MTVREHVCTLSRRVPVRTHTHTPTHACVHPVIHPSVHSQQAKMKNGRFSTQNVTRVVKGSGDSDVKRKLINALRCPGVGAAPCLRNRLKPGGGTWPPCPRPVAASALLRDPPLAAGASEPGWAPSDVPRCRPARVKRAAGCGGGRGVRGAAASDGPRASTPRGGRWSRGAHRTPPDFNAKTVIK